jgi:hypothetical protein
MTKTRIIGLVLCLTLFWLAIALTVVNGTTEGNYKNNINLLPQMFETKLVENGYKASIMINPYVTGMYAFENGYKLDLTINSNGIGGELTENNYKLDLIPEKSFPEIPDIAITNMVTSNTAINQGDILFINVTVSNYSFDYETFNLTIYVNATAIDTQTIILTGKNSTTISTAWSTTSYETPIGNYIISSYTSPPPGETNTYDNTYTYGTVQVALSTSGGGGRMPYCS